MRHRHHHRIARCRWWADELAAWRVHGRIERFVEPAILLLLRDRPRHGYDLAEGLGELAPEDRVDLGNLYRLLRDLEVEGLVRSRMGGRKRIYELTDDGRDVLDAWADGLGRTRRMIDGFLRRYRAASA